GTDPVYPMAGRSRQPILVKIHKPLDGHLPRQLIAIDNQAAGHAHHEEVRGDDRPHPKVNLEQDVAHPELFRGVEPLLPGGPRGHRSITFRSSSAHAIAVLRVTNKPRL